MARSRSSALVRILAVVAMGASHGWALDLKKLDKTVFAALAAKANETVDVTFDQNTLKFASSFLPSNGDEDVARVKKLITGLRSVVVRSFEFKTKGEYTTADLDAIREVIKSDWTHVVSVHNKGDGDNADVYILPGGSKPEGLFIIAAEPLELTVVYIDGRIDLNDLAGLEGLGIPQIDKDGKIRKFNKDKDDN